MYGTLGRKIAFGAITLAALAVLASGCARSPCGEPPAGEARISWEEFGTDKEGETVYVHTLENSAGMKARIMDRGGILLSLTAPDRDGNFADVVLGYDTLEPYLESYPYFGCITGRVANRIAYGKFTLDGKDYQLATNNNEHHLHGGDAGFDKVYWRIEHLYTADGVALELSYVSKDGEEGYPGNLDVTVVYELTNSNEFVIDYSAKTDQATPVNLTQHSYFNLTGGKENVLGHKLKIKADQVTAVDEGLIPTGELASVAGTPLDFRTPRLIGERIEAVGGYDHNYVIKKESDGVERIAVVLEPDSGRIMEVFTDQPGVQLYTANFLGAADSPPGKGGQAYEKHGALCLETQHYPDSPNRPEFPSVILRPGETYATRTVYKFSAE